MLTRDAWRRMAVMELTLVIVTLFSLALALGLGFVAWRLLQDDRRRADARVAALVEGFAQRAATDPPGSWQPHDRGLHAQAEGAREANAEAPAFAFRDQAAPATADDAAAALDANGASRAHAAASVADDEIAADAKTEHVNGLQPVLLDAASRDWLLEFPSARTDAARVEKASTPADDDWDDAPIDDEPEDVSIAHAAWPEVRRVNAARQTPVRDWREVRVEAAHDTRDTRDTHETRATDLPDPPAPAPSSAPFAASESAHELFGQIAQADEAANTNRFTQVALIVALLFGVGLSVWTVSRLVVSAAGGGPAAAASASGAAGANGAASSATGAGAGATAAASAPLELLALRQSRNGTALTIDGLVRNPSTGARQERLTAVVFFYDARGQFLTSARAPLDFRALAPGDESPFQLTLTPPSGVSRYRVSFRYDEGGIVAHVDRRQAATAQALSRAGS